VKHDIVTLGASAGGVEALQAVVRSIPATIDAAFFVVMHLSAWSRSELPRILSNAGPLPAMHARDDEPIEQGRIYVAPPDYHLVLEDSRTVLWRGPKENRSRPSINVLFRSAAVAYRERVTGVVLSGALDDGSAGLWWIRRYGGAAIVQDPAEAIVPDMPRSALEHVDTARIARLSEIGLLVSRLAAGKEV